MSGSSSHRARTRGRSNAEVLLSATLALTAACLKPAEGEPPGTVVPASLTVEDGAALVFHDAGAQMLAQALADDGCVLGAAPSDSASAPSGHLRLLFQASCDDGYVATLAARVGNLGVVGLAAARYRIEGTDTLQVLPPRLDAAGRVLPAEVLISKWQGSPLFEAMRAIAMARPAGDAVTAAGAELGASRAAQTNAAHCAETQVLAVSSGCCACQAATSCSVAAYEAYGSPTISNSLLTDLSSAEVCLIAAGPEAFEGRDDLFYAVVDAIVASGTRSVARSGVSGHQELCSSIGFCAAPVCHVEAACTPWTKEEVRCASDDPTCSSVDEKDIYTTTVGGGLMCNFGACVGCFDGNCPAGTGECEFFCNTPVTEVEADAAPPWACGP